MKERPPILSDEQIDAAWPSEAGDGFPEHSVDTIDALTLELMRCAKVVAQAQRDADVEWYSKLEMQYLDDCREVNEMQIHQETVKELFEEIEKVENPYSEYLTDGVFRNHLGFEECRQKILALLEEL